MSSGLYYAISGFKCQEREMEILSHGLSNVNTTGYKDDLPSFKGVHAPFNSYLPLETLEDHRRLFLMQKMNMDYPGLSYVQTDFSQGQLKYTGSDFNIAIEGEGFLVIDTPQGERYTRLGNLSLNRKNELVVGEGNYPLKAEIKGEKKKKKEPYIKIQEIKKDFVIGRDGAIAVDGIPLNTLKVVDFKDYSQLKKMGDHLPKGYSCNGRNGCTCYQGCRCGSLKDNAERRVQCHYGLYGQQRREWKDRP